MRRLIERLLNYLRRMGHRILYIPKPQSEFSEVNFGVLYNGWAVKTGLMGNSGFAVPTETQWDSLITYVGGTSVAGRELKLDGEVFWASGNTGENNYGLGLKGAGERPSNGFQGILARGIFYSQTAASSSRMIGYRFDSTSNASYKYLGAFGGINNYVGCSVILCKPAPGESDGVQGVYTDNSGNTYKTIVINEIEWLTNPLIDTKYSNNSTITEVTDQTTWNGLTTGALCAYNNDWNNV